MKYKRLLSGFCAAFLLSGCSLFGGVVEKIADTVDDYCTKEPYSQRQVYRESINEELQPKGHSVNVQCNGDPVD